ncbi:ribosome maturation factor RimP [Ruaniaceae bacterium KH17]|nr:ribosome maturation factor RimP [Ruaniaceae bacterium KH17]
MEQELYAQLAGPVAESGLFLESLTLTQGKRARLQVVVDLPEGPGGVTSDQLADATRAVNAVLDADPDAIPGSYTLEVTTPGISRPMTDERQFGRAVGRLVKATIDGETFTERLAAVREGTLVFETREVPIADVRKAVQEIEMGKGK